MYFQGNVDPRALAAGQVGGEAMYAGASEPPAEMGNGSGQIGNATSDAYLALANAKLAIRAAKAAASAGNCGGAQEKLAEAWQQLFHYSQLAAQAGMSPKIALSLHGQLARIETLGAMNCSGLRGVSASAMRGAGEEPPGGKMVPLIIGGVVAAVVVGGIIWAVMRKDPE